jgi:hypothetical protein
LYAVPANELKRLLGAFGSQDPHALLLKYLLERGEITQFVIHDENRNLITGDRG